MNARAVAFYLPQFHPVPENDEWWGPGFTEWTNVAKAKPLFRGHKQPHVPADLGFYDLRVPETREAQAELARRYGIEGFCYYHYWFAGRRILERPLDEVLASGAPDFPFCICWANDSWSGIWYGAPDHILLRQTYPGRADHEAHFQTLLPAFKDSRYIRVDGKPIFIIFKPQDLPDRASVVELWRGMAERAGLGGLHIVGISWHTDWQPADDGFDAKVEMPPMRRTWISRRRPIERIRARLDEWRGLPHNYSYAEFAAMHMPVATAGDTSYPCVTHAWDNTPRSGRRGVVLRDSTPELFRSVLDAAVRQVKGRPPDHRLVFLKAWNEWAEGNYLEPDLEHGHRYLEQVGQALGAVMPEAC